jgi:hypothetical protein
LLARRAVRRPGRWTILAALGCAVLLVVGATVHPLYGTLGALLAIGAVEGARRRASGVREAPAG